MGDGRAGLVAGGIKGGTSRRPPKGAAPMSAVKRKSASEVWPPLFAAVVVVSLSFLALPLLHDITHRYHIPQVPPMVCGYSTFTAISQLHLGTDPA